MKKKISAFILATLLAFSNILIVSAQEIDEENPVLQEEAEVLESENLEETVESEEETKMQALVPETQEEIENEEVVYSRDFVGKTESDIPEEILNDENTIVKYVFDERVEEGVVLDQSLEDGNTIFEIATEPLPVESKSSFNLLNTFDLFSETTEAPSVENDNWDEYPVSYEYNWDNSQNAWNYGEWRDGVSYKTEPGTYDNNVRHAMGMYTDGENIHLHISYATVYQSIANGDDFNFYIDGVGAKVRVLYADNGSGITGQARETGTYDLVVVNGDHWNSGYEANGSYGTMIVKDGNINNELEIVVPLSTLKEQNANINTDNIMNIEFFTPNLMYRSISCGGASSGSNYFVFMTIAIFGIAFIVYKKKENIFVR